MARSGSPTSARRIREMEGHAPPKTTRNKNNNNKNAATSSTNSPTASIHSPLPRGKHKPLGWMPAAQKYLYKEAKEHASSAMASNHNKCNNNNAKKRMKKSGSASSKITTPLTSSRAAAHNIHNAEALAPVWGLHLPPPPPLPTTPTDASLSQQARMQLLRPPPPPIAWVSEDPWLTMYERHVVQHLLYTTSAGGKHFLAEMLYDMRTAHMKKG